MPLKTSGSGRVKRLISRIPDAAREEFDKANREGAEMIVDVAKALISSRSGASRAAIKNAPGVDGGQIIDFGPLSKIIEGGTAPRTTKDGQNRGSGPAQPFVQPALQGTKRKRRAINRKAVKRALRKAKNG